MIFFDTETLGFTGPCVLIQWAEDNGPVQLHEVWREPTARTLRLIERFSNHLDGVCGFNLAFDWFHLQRTYSVLSSAASGEPPTAAAWIAGEAAPKDVCCKPVTAHDVMLHARKGPMQSLMERDDIRVRRVPKVLAPYLAEELAARIDLDEIYFGKRRDGYKWHVVEDPDDPDFPDVVLRFGADGRLKTLAKNLLGVDVVTMEDNALDHFRGPAWHFRDTGWQPFLKPHVDYWAKNETGRRYAREDVEWTRRLYKHFGSPPPGDDDSVLACQVGSARFRGWRIDLPLLEEIREETIRVKESAPRSPGAVKAGLHERLTEIERLAVTDTRNETLTALVGRRDGDGLWTSGQFPETHPVVPFGRAVIEARSAEKQDEVCNKLLTCGRAHFDFKVLGALSGRMSGASKLNPQGIPTRKKGSRLRDAFPLADDGFELDGGDFDGFEVTLAAAVYGDDQLIADLESGQKIHALYGSSMYEMDYDDVKAAEDLYGRAKNAFFGSLYGAQDPKLAETLGLSLDQVAGGRERFQARYPGVGRAQREVADRFCSMRQPGGIGTVVQWHEPADYIESLFGFRRYFTLENKICRALFDLGQEPPPEWRELKFKVTRREGRRQTPGGATASALYGAAFGIQARNLRAAANHEIQASGAQITKRLQRRVWDRQPAGVNAWIVQPMNVHDEVLAPRRRGLDLQPVVEGVIEEFRPRVPLLSMAWKQGVEHWGALK